MQASISRTEIGCIGKCTSGMSLEELDLVTDNIHRTLTHPRGKAIFKTYLKKRNLRNYLECLSLYEACCAVTDKAENQRQLDLPLESLIKNVTAISDRVDDLDGVPGIDRELQLQFDEAIRKARESGSRIDLLSVVVETRDHCSNHLTNIHESFKKYASEPCPLSKK